jgi:2-oxoglutarate ferredoxin oxidoreductase subunit beta
VTFNNNDESLRSYTYVKDNDVELHAYDYIPTYSPIEGVEVPEGEFHDITLFDGSTLRLETIGSDHDPTDAVAALGALHKAELENKHVTGLLYFDPTKATAAEDQCLVETPLSEVDDEVMRPNSASLDTLNARFRGKA